MVAPPRRRGRTATTTPATAPTSYSYNGANELTALNGSSTGWAYDANGNETAGNSAIPRTSETYSASDQLLSGTASGTSFSATYAGLSNTERVTAGSTTFENGPEGLADQTASGSTTYWTRDPGGTLIGERVGSSHYYYVFDGLGSVVAVVNAIGAIKNTYSYDPYRNLRSSSVTLANPFEYIAGYNDGTGLYHLGARYYDATLGRFTQQDPAGIESNLYAYSASNPVNDIDPSGRLSFSIGANICFFICIGGGYSSDVSGNSAPYISFGFGSPGVGGGITASSGNVSSGFAGSVDCSAGFATVGVSTGGNVSAGLGTYASTPTCGGSVSYTF